MSKGNVNSVIKLLSNNMEGGVLPLNKKTIDLLKVKHLVGKAASEDTKLHDSLPAVENIIFDINGSGGGENYSRRLGAIRNEYRLLETNPGIKRLW